MKKQPTTYREIREYLESKLLGKTPKRGAWFEVMKAINNIEVYKEPMLAKLSAQMDYSATQNDLNLFCCGNWQRYFLASIRVKINDHGTITGVEMFDSDDNWLEDVITQINLEYAERRCQA